MKSKKHAWTDKNRCVACGACTHECPRQAITIWKGCYADINMDKCVGCGKCSTVCPVGCIELRIREDRNE